MYKLRCSSKFHEVVSGYFSSCTFERGGMIFLVAFLYFNYEGYYALWYFYIFLQKKLWDIFNCIPPLVRDRAQ